MVDCPRCHTDIGSPTPPKCYYCGYDFHHPESNAGSPAAIQSHPACPSCKAAMDKAGDLNFRVGGSAGGTGFFLGNWNQLSESLQAFAVYHCKSCGKVEFWESGR
jgi:hypothetical protein